MLAVDLPHEFEVGVWKALFTHLLWIISSINPALQVVMKCILFVFADMQSPGIGRFHPLALQPFANFHQMFRK